MVKRLWGFSLSSYHLKLKSVQHIIQEVRVRTVKFRQPNMNKSENGMKSLDFIEFQIEFAH